MLAKTALATAGATQTMGVSPAGEGTSGRYRTWCLRAFAAILDEERDALTNIAPTLQKLREEFAAAQAQP